jgi:tetratricopeptide (TPR) repeat protein
LEATLLKDSRVGTGGNGSIMAVREREASHWLRELVDFGLDYDLTEEIQRQEQIASSGSGSARAHFNLGILHYSRGFRYEAIGEFLMAIEIDPYFASGYRKLGEVYVGLGDYEQAGRYAVKAAECADPALLEAFRRYPAMQHFVEVS